MQPNTTVVFVHMPKSGGISLRYGIEPNFTVNSESRQIVYGHTSPPDLKASQDMDEEQLRKVKFAWAHWPFGFYSENVSNLNDTVWITVLRDPVDRVLSEYHDFKSRPEYSYEGYYHFWYELYNKHPIEEILDVEFIKSLPIEQGQQVYRRISNTQTRMLSGSDGIIFDHIGSNPDGSFRLWNDYILEEKHCAAAIRNLDNHFSWIGITSRVTQEFNALNSRFGWKHGIGGVIHNPTVSRLYEKDYSKEVIDKIKEWNQYDCRIWEWARTNRYAVNTRPIIYVSPEVFEAPLLSKTLLKV